ncbi:MAG: hypothetical protein KKF88_03285 [Alphaproteobacteria bacterium]|nr:hypothetical protein [Alphaproteobacteria bacterium]
MKAVPTASRLVVATFCAGVLAATAYVMQLAVFGVVKDGPAGAVVGAVTFFLAGPAFLIGTALFGPPIWLIVRKTRVNQPQPSALIGAGIALIAGALLFLSWAGWDGVWITAAFPLAGGVGGGIFQRMMAEGAT